MDLHILFFQQRYFFSSVLPVFLLTYSYFWKQKEQIRMKGIASVFALCTILLSSCARSLESTTDVVRPGDRSRTSAYRCLTDGQLRPTAFAAVPPCSYSSTRTAPPAEGAARLEKLHQSIPLRMLAISREEPDSSIRHFWQANNLSIPYAPQAGRQIYRQFAIRYIPRLYLTDSTGCIRHVFRSVTPNRKIRKAWKKLSSSHP